MLRTDLDTPLLVGPSTAARPLLRSLRLCASGILFVCCAVLGATQCSAQDVAEAARQERTQKESKQKKTKHVYTEQDLKRENVFGFLLLAFFLGAFLSSRFGDVLSGTLRRAQNGATHKKDSGSAQTQRAQQIPCGGRGAN